MKKTTLCRRLYIVIFIAVASILIVGTTVYFGARNSVLENADETARNLIDQAANNVSNTLSYVINSAQELSFNSSVQQLLVTQDRTEQLALYQSTNEVVSAVKASNPMIYSVSWIGENGRRVSDSLRNDNKIVSSVITAYPDLTTINKPVFTSLIHVDSKESYYAAYAFPVFSLTSTFYNKVGCGIYVLDINIIKNAVVLDNSSDFTTFVILDSECNVIASNKTYNVGTVFSQQFWDGDSEYEKTVAVINGEEMIIQSMPVPESGWRVVSMMRVNDLVGKLNSVVLMTGVLTVIACIMLLLSGHIMLHEIRLPMDKIVRFLTDSDVSKRITPIKIYEFDVIASHINMMLDKYNEAQQKNAETQRLLYESKLTEQKAEISVLQSQINPHFLYNTLSCMSSIGLAYGVTEITEIAASLANIYRYSVKGGKIVTLREEIKCIREYMKIMEIRFPDGIDTQYDISDELYDKHILHMLLQPVVENAVYHGIEQTLGRCKLRIKANLENQNVLVVTIINNGSIIPADMLESVRKAIADYDPTEPRNGKGGIGLANLNRRIQLQYGNEYGVTIDSSHDTGTVVKIRVSC